LHSIVYVILGSTIIVQLRLVTDRVWSTDKYKCREADTCSLLPCSRPAHWWCVVRFI